MFYFSQYVLHVYGGIVRQVFLLTKLIISNPKPWEILYISQQKNTKFDEEKHISYNFITYDFISYIKVIIIMMDNSIKHFIVNV